MYKKKIAFIHNNCKDFRYPVFSNLDSDERLDVEFFLLEEPVKPLSNYRVLKSLRIPLLQDFIIPLGLWRSLKEKDYEYVISTDLGYVITYIGFLYSIFNNAKFILWNEQWKHISHPRRILTRFFEKIICKKSYKVFAFGNKHVDFVSSLGTKKENIIHMPNAVPNISDFPTQEDYIPYNKDEKYILCLARLIKIKGHESLIKAFSIISSEYPNYRLIIAGEGKEYDKLTELINKLDLNDKVYMPNKAVCQKNKFKLYDKSEIVVLPSIQTRTVEAWGLVINEAALFKKSILVSSATGVESDLIKNKYSGLVFEQNNEIDLSKKLDVLISNPDLRKLFSTNAYNLVCDYYNTDVLSNRILESLNEK